MTAATAELVMVMVMVEVNVLIRDENGIERENKRKFMIYQNRRLILTCKVDAQQKV